MGLSPLLSAWWVLVVVGVVGLLLICGAGVYLLRQAARADAEPSPASFLRAPLYPPTSPVVSIEPVAVHHAHAASESHLAARAASTTPPPPMVSRPSHVALPSAFAAPSQPAPPAPPPATMPPAPSFGQGVPTSPTPTVRPSPDATLPLAALSAAPTTTKSPVDQSKLTTLVSPTFPASSEPPRPPRKTLPPSPLRVAPRPFQLSTLSVRDATSLLEGQLDSGLPPAPDTEPSMEDEGPTAMMSWSQPRSPRGSA